MLKNNKKQYQRTANVRTNKKTNKGRISYNYSTMTKRNARKAFKRVCNEYMQYINEVIVSMADVLVQARQSLQNQTQYIEHYDENHRISHCDFSESLIYNNLDDTMQKHMFSSLVEYVSRTIQEYMFLLSAMMDRADMMREHQEKHNYDHSQEEIYRKAMMSIGDASVKTVTNFNKIIEWYNLEVALFIEQAVKNNPSISLKTGTSTVADTSQSAMVETITSESTDTAEEQESVHPSTDIQYQSIELNEDLYYGETDPEYNDHRVTYSP